MVFHAWYHLVCYAHTVNCMHIVSRSSNFALLLFALVASHGTPAKQGAPPFLHEGLNECSRVKPGLPLPCSSRPS